MKKIIIIVLIAIIVFTLIFNGLIFENGKIYIRSFDYKASNVGPSCAALSPECGDCIKGQGIEGVVRGDTCYLPL